MHCEHDGVPRLQRNLDCRQRAHDFFLERGMTGRNASLFLIVSGEKRAKPFGIEVGFNVACW
jgi:hypothetical protein